MGTIRIIWYDLYLLKVKSIYINNKGLSNPRDLNSSFILKLPVFEQSEGSVQLELYSY